MKKPKHASTKQLVEIHQKLTEVLTKNEHNEFWHYQSGWTDQRLAEEMNVSRSSVVRVRRENFGELRRGERGDVNDNDKNLLYRIALVETYLDELDPNWRSSDE